MPKRNWKMVSFWILGALCILLGAMIAGNAEKSLGTGDSAFFTALLVAFVLMLLGGILWISVAVGTKFSVEELI